MFPPQMMHQLMGMLQNSNNPMAVMQNMFGNDPIMQRAIQMAQGKSPEQLQQTVRNLAQQRGMSTEQLNQFLSQYGLKL